MKHPQDRGSTEKGERRKAWLRYGPIPKIINLTPAVLLSFCGLAAFSLSPAQAQVPAGDLRLLALGDSLTAGYGLPLADSFPAQLERALRAQGLAVSVINAGVSGDTTAGGRARLDWALQDKPDAVLVELGANDGLRGLDPVQTRANLDAILTKLQDAGLPILLTGMLAPPNLGVSYGAGFNALFPDLARQHHVAFYPFFLDGAAAQPPLLQADGMHPNAQGVAVIVSRILPATTKLLAQKKGK